MLFRPFNIGKWFCLGFSAWLASFLDGSGSSSGGSYNGSNSSSKSEVTDTLHWVTSLGLNTGIGIAVGVGVLIVLLTLVFIWLGARGQFMFLDNVIRNRSEIAAPWRAFRAAGNSLFRFYGLICLGAFALMMGFLVFALIFCWADLVAVRLRPFGEYLPLVIPFVGLLLLLVPLMIVLFFYREFGVPIMYASRCTAWQAAGTVWVLATERPLDFLIYLLIRMAMGFVFLIVAIMLGCLTCCLGFLPYLSAVLTLPLRVFRISYTLDCLTQFGPDFDLWSKAELPPPQP